MKKIIIFLFVSTFITVLSGCNNSSNAKDTQETIFRWNGDNDNPITAVYELTEDDIENDVQRAIRYI